MVNCAICKRKIGFFEKRYDYENKEGKTIEICSGCNDKWCREKEKERIALREREAKESEQNKKKEEQIINKYISAFLKKFEPAYIHFIDIDFFGEISSVNEIIIKTLHAEGSWVTKSFSKDYNPSSLGYLLDKKTKESIIESARQICNVLYASNFSFLSDSLILNYKNKGQGYLELFNLLKNDDIDNLIMLISKRENINLSLNKTISKIIEVSKQIKREEVYKELSQLKIDDLNSYMEQILETYQENYVAVIEYLYDYALEKKIEVVGLKEFYNKIHDFKENIDLGHFEKSLFKEPSKSEFSIRNVDALSGTEFEHFLSKLFSQLGYSTEVTKQSGDQGADLIITKHGGKTVVQAKRFSGRVGNKAVQEITAAKKFYNAENALIVTNSYFTKSAITLAHSNNVELWNRQKLIELIESYINK